MGSSDYDWKSSTVDDNFDLYWYPVSRTPTPEGFDQLNFSCLLDSTSFLRGKSDSESRVLVKKSMNLMGCVDMEAHVSKTISPNLIEKDLGNEEATIRKRKRSAPPPPNPNAKSMDVISTTEYLFLGRSAKRKYEMAYSNSEGTFYGLKSSRLETPQEFIVKTRKLYRELKTFGKENSHRFSLSTAAMVGRTRYFNETDSTKVDVEGHLQISFEDLINLDIWDSEN